MRIVWGQVSHVISPIISLGGILKLFILQHKWYNPNSESSNIVVMNSCHFPLPYFCIYEFVWRHRWRHGALLGIQRFLSMTSYQIKIEIRKGTIVLALSSRTDRYATWSLNSIRNLRGVTWPWTRVNLDFDLYQTKDISFDAAWWKDYDGVWILPLYNHFWRSYEPKTKPRLLGHWPDYPPLLMLDVRWWKAAIADYTWIHWTELTFEVTGWPVILNLGTNRIALAQLWARRLGGGVVSPRPGRM